MVSIIVPIYKVEKYLRACIDSLINQTYRDIEIILVDDGSPDDCGRICDEYAIHDSRVKVVHQPNAGVSAARNAGLDIAGGEFIGFCDPDDFVAEDMYMCLVDAMKRHDADLAACGYNYYSEDYILDSSRLYPLMEDETMSRRDIYSKLSDMPPTIRHGVVTKLFRAAIIGDLRFDIRLKSAEDCDFLLSYAKRVNSAVFVHRPLYMNLVRDGSATHGGLNIKSLTDSFAVHNSMYEDTVNYDPKLKDKAIAFLMDVCTLKYNEAKARGVKSGDFDECLRAMHRFLRKKALTALTSRSILWKTKLYYLLFWIRK